jgi:hypothetical protein
MLNGKAYPVIYAAAGDTICNKRPGYAFITEKGQKPPMQVEVGSWTRSYLILLESMAINLDILIKPKLSVNARRGESKNDWATRNLPSWKAETEPENIREITKNDCNSGIAVFNASTWPATLIYDHPLWDDKSRYVQQVLADATINQTIFVSDFRQAGTAAASPSQVKNVSPTAPKPARAADTSKTPPPDGRPKIHYETRDGKSQWRPVGPHMMKREKIRQLMNMEKNSNHFRKFMEYQTQWFLNTQRGKKAGARYDIRDMKPDWKPPESR